MTTGWGNLISRRGGHWSFPFEIGAVFTGSPTLALNPTGNGCLTAADAADTRPFLRQHGHRFYGADKRRGRSRQIPERP